MFGAPYGDIKRSVLCVFHVFCCPGVRASQADENERKKKKYGFLKSNISRCVYAFTQVMMFSRAV